MSSRATPYRSAPGNTSAAGRLRRLCRILYGQHASSSLMPILILWLLHLCLYLICLWLGYAEKPGAFLRFAAARLSLYLILPAAWEQIAHSTGLGHKTGHALAGALVLAEGLLLLGTAKILALHGGGITLPFGRFIDLLKALAGKGG